MSLDEFIKKFSDCFHSTNPDLIKAETKFKELDEWGSMMALIVIAMIDSDYGKTITSDDIKSSETVSDLFAKLSS